MTKSNVCVCLVPKRTVRLQGAAERLWVCEARGAGALMGHLSAGKCMMVNVILMSLLII